MQVNEKSNVGWNFYTEWTAHDTVQDLKGYIEWQGSRVINGSFQEGQRSSEPWMDFCENVCFTPTQTHRHTNTWYYCSIDRGDLLNVLMQRQLSVQIGDSTVFSRSKYKPSCGDNYKSVLKYVKTKSSKIHEGTILPIEWKPDICVNVLTRSAVVIGKGWGCRWLPYVHWISR